MIKNALIKGNTYRILNIFYDQNYYGNPNQNWIHGIKPHVYARLLDCSNQNTIDVYASNQMTKGVIPHYNLSNSRTLLTTTINSENLDLKRALFLKYLGQNLTTKKYQFQVSTSSPFVKPVVSTETEISMHQNEPTEIKKPSSNIPNPSSSGGQGNWFVGDPNTKPSTGTTGKNQQNNKRVNKPNH